MNTGISWDAYGSGELPIEKQISIFKENGITNTFTGSERFDIFETAEKIKESGIIIDALHAPFSGKININAMWLKGDYGNTMLARLTDGVDKCSSLDIPVLVVHLSSGDICPGISDAGSVRFSKLMEYADAKNVKIAYENQRKLANLAFAMEEFPTAGFCWDCGHEACFAYGRQYMPLFSDRLCALHIHDNYAVHEGDKHMIPFDAGLDFDRITTQIADSGYEGTVMLELARHTSGQYENISAEDYYSRASAAVHKLRDMIEQKRN